MRRIVFFLGFLSLLALSGCCGPRNVVVLLPDRDGNVGAIEMSNAHGSRLVDKAGEGISVTSHSSAPKASAFMSPEDIRKTFKEALSAEPLAPKSFLLYFETGGVKLTTESQETISQILEVIRKRQSRDISVIGHSDSSGSRKLNYIISTNRAEHVRDILIADGVADTILHVSSHGEGNPLVPTVDNVSEPKNRRVEVVIR